jgi:ATP-dependent Clp protease ATP-binding subunit ClpA
MFERFTTGARDAVVYAQREASALRHNYIGTEHLLLGLLHEGMGLGGEALDRLGIRFHDVRSDVVAIVGEGLIDDAEALEAIGIDLGEVHRRMEETFGPGALQEAAPPRQRLWRGRRCTPASGYLTQRVAGRIPFTPRAKKVLELALREATALRHGYIGTGHIVLGIAREGEGLAAEILARRGATGRRVSEDVMEALERGVTPEDLS